MTIIGKRQVGDGNPVYIVAEIGINHNGSLDLALELIDLAKEAGADAVKFQKRNPDVSVPFYQRDLMRDTPWGYISYIDYKRRLEFGQYEYDRIATHCERIGIDWFASVWDVESLIFMAQYNVVAYKLPSACITDMELIHKAAIQRMRGVDDPIRPVILSTGMSTMEQIETALHTLLRPGPLTFDQVILLHCTSTYPCQPSELNLRMIPTLRAKFPCAVGYSGHEAGLPTTVAAVALGACMVERHFTRDRTMWGTDQAASVEPGGFERLVHYIRVTEQALGDGVKRVYDSELEAMRKLRR